jgi:PAS domain S-box-containing protein
MTRPKQGAHPPPGDQLLRLIFESARDYAIFTMDTDGLVTSWNPGAERVLGWSTEEILNCTADVIFTSEDRAAGAAEQERIQAAATGRATDERWQQRKDGKRFWASGLLMALEDPDQGFVKILRDRTEQHLANEQLRQSQERQAVLMAELQHRTRNLLGLAQAIALQTLRRHPSSADFERDFTRRLNALGRVQALISAADYRDVDLHDLVAAELQAHHDDRLHPDRIRLRGPAVRLSTAAAQAMGLAIHELTTNAVKYGALGKDSGVLTVDWHLEDRKGNAWVVVVWKEAGIVLPAEAGTKAGYGRELIEQALPYQLAAETRLEFEPDGVRCTIATSLRNTADG